MHSKINGGSGDLRTPRTTLKRRATRGAYDRATVDAILDEGLVCHVGFVHAGQPFVIPTAYGRVGDQLYVHGSAANRMLGTLREGVPLCLTVTLLDGLVLARSAFHHSVNYRSVILLGLATEVTDPAEKRIALEAIVEHVVPGRWPLVRPPSDRELAATLVLRLPIAEGSAKIRSGPPLDDAEDAAVRCWAGEVPLRLVADSPIDDSRLPLGAPAPVDVAVYARSRA